MAKGISIKFTNYSETIPRILKLIKLDDELKKHDRVVLKPFARDYDSPYTSPEFLEAVVKFCVENKKPNAEIIIAEGSDGEDTIELFESIGYKGIAEKYSVALADLNKADVEEISSSDFMKFESVMYPKMLKDSFIISLPKLFEDEETEMLGSLANMIGVFPGDYYRGFFSSRKNKLRKWNMKYAIHDIIRCKMPQLAVIDASEKGFILAGQSLEMDKQAAKVLGREWKAIEHLKIADERFQEVEKKTPQQKV